MPSILERLEYWVNKNPQKLLYAFLDLRGTETERYTYEGFLQRIVTLYHVTRDNYTNMVDITNMINQLTGREFELFKLSAFVPEVIRRCTKDDPLFPLLDFLIGSVDNIASMEFKRYDSSHYRRARSASRWAQPDPSLEDTVRGILRFMRRTGIVPAGVPIPDSERSLLVDRHEDERGVPQLA